MAQTTFRITPIYDILLRGSQDMPIGLFHLQTATAEQLHQLHYKPGCIKAVKARLKDLAEAGYVQHDVIPGREFRRPYYYALGTKGARYLQSIGLDTNDAFRASKEVGKHGLFVDHALELNDVVIAAALLKSVGSGFYLYNFVHERTLRRRPYKASWRIGGRQESTSLIPDGLLDFRYADDVRHLTRCSIPLRERRSSEEMTSGSLGPPGGES